ncbi:hypothetical protein FGB62_43g119 [Gracilaria domingensis]|nr:hypothetical protein FGB62_43g119 [Gracilaria domingensis]
MGRKRSYSNRTSQSQNIEDDEMLDARDSSAADSGYSALTEAQQDDVAKRISRTLMFRQHRKRPVRRAELSAVALKNLPPVRGKPRVFKLAFDTAKDMMRKTFGVEVKEIQKLTKRKTGPQSRSTASASQGYGYGCGAKGYILLSKLAKRHEVPDILCEIGFLTLIAALIALQPGCRIEEDTLHHTLSKLGVHVREKQGHKQLNNGNVKDLLENKFLDMWYLEKEKEGNVTYYMLGPRLRAELSDDDLLEFIHAVYKDGPSGHGMLDENGRNEIKARLNDAWGPEGPPDERENED